MTGLTMVQTLPIFRDSILIIAPVLNNLGNKRRGVVIITTAQLHSTKPELSHSTFAVAVGDSRWKGSLTMVPARNKAKCPSPVNHTTKTIHHHHHHHHHHHYFHHQTKYQIRRLDKNNTICLTENSIKVDLSSRETFILFLRLIFYHNFSTVTTIKYFSLRSIFCQRNGRQII